MFIDSMKWRPVAIKQSYKRKFNSNFITCITITLAVAMMSAYIYLYTTDHRNTCVERYTIFHIFNSRFYAVADVGSQFTHRSIRESNVSKLEFTFGFPPITHFTSIDCNFAHSDVEIAFSPNAEFQPSVEVRELCRCFRLTY